MKDRPVYDEDLAVGNAPVRDVSDSKADSHVDREAIAEPRHDAQHRAARAIGSAKCMHMHRDRDP